MTTHTPRLLKVKNMNSTKRLFWRRSGVALAAAGMVLLGGVTAAPAAAAPIGPNLDPNATGSIIVHKLVQPAAATGLPNDGSALTPEQLAGLIPLAGVGFSTQRVSSIDLTTNAGWDATNGLTAAAVLNDPATYPLTASGSGTTNASGDATFGGLPVGLYLVTETDPGANPIAQMSPPFLVTIPLSTENDTWLYDVNVYPKNAVTEVTKTVDDSDAFGLGDTVDWAVNGTVPYLAADGTIDRFTLLDPLDTRLTYASPAARVSAKTATGVALALTADDYVISAPAAGATGTVRVDFTAAGRAKLQDNPGAVVTMNLTTTVTAIGDGSIENTATLLTNDARNSSDAVTSWGALRIFKYGTAGAQEGLQGAQFQIFRTANDAAAHTNPVSVNDRETFISGTDGNIDVDGLHVGDYWIVETAAPTGYQANATPIRVSVVESSTADPVIVRVANTQVAAWMLPLTGGGGTALIIASGAALIAVAGGAAAITRRRRTPAQA